MTEFALALCMALPKVLNRLAEKAPKRIKMDWCLVAALGFAWLTGAAYLSQAPIELGLFQIGESLHFALRLDTLSGLISCTVMLIGASVLKYSVRHLSDDARRIPFQRNMASTLCFVLLMLNSSNLLMYWLSWVGVSFFLRRLLLHFGEREGAQQAAKEKFWVTRLGDLFLIWAMAAIFAIFGTLNFNEILLQWRSPDFVAENLPLYYAAAFFLVLGAMTKSAQFPFHFWLPKTMETPAPVSALMHAGIINAGGFLVVRMGPFLNEVPLALHGLALVGGFTALFGSIVMLSQTSVKRSLAYSTIAQMGFMMLQCGLGAFSIAVVHIIGHAFYKAYSFLGAGATTDYGKLQRYLPKPSKSHSAWTLVLVSAVFVTLMIAAGPALGYHYDKPGALLLLLVLGLAFSQIYLSYESKSDAFLAMASLTVSYFGLYHFVDFIVQASTLNSATSLQAGQGIVYGVVGLPFILLFLAQNNLSWISQTQLGRKLYVNTMNGALHG